MPLQKPIWIDKNNVVKFNQIHILEHSVFNHLFMSVPSGALQEIYLYNSLKQQGGLEQQCQGIYPLEVSLTSDRRMKKIGFGEGRIRGYYLLQLHSADW